MTFDVGKLHTLEYHLKSINERINHAGAMIYEWQTKQRALIAEREKLEAEKIGLFENHS